MKAMTAALMVLALAACTAPAQRSVAPGSATTPVKVRDSSVPIQTVRYSRTEGTCSAGAVQLLTREQFEELRAGWSLPDGCRGPEKKQVPGVTGYPARFAALKRSGSAQVLVRIEADGSVESVHAVCATDSAFAEAAEETARTIVYIPGTCGSRAIRSAFLLPLDYDFR